MKTNRMKNNRSEITAGGATTESSDRGVVRFEIAVARDIDASSGTDSFETEFLRLSDFQNAMFGWISTSGKPLINDFEATPQKRSAVRRLRRRASGGNH